MGQRYIIGTATSAVAIQRGPRTLITIPVGGGIDVAQPLMEADGLVEVTYNGEAILMFAEDIRERGTPILGASV